MYWNKLPNELIKKILNCRKILTCVNKIISIWKCYKIRVLIGRFKMLRYLKDFRLFNPNIKIFLLRSRL